MLHNLFPIKVALEPELHQYFDGEGKQYLSVSEFLKLLYELFENTRAYKLASDDTKLAWKQKGQVAAGHGDVVHKALELYGQTGQILQTNAHLESAIKSIIGEYSDYYQTYDEVCLYSEKYRVAGTTDKICALSNRRDCEVDIIDFKTNLFKGVTYHSDYKKRMYAPLDHLQECSYVKYSLQLSLYAHFFEELTGRRVRKIFIHFVPPDDMTKHYKIPVIYMKNDIKTLLELHKETVLRRVEPIVITQENDECF